MRWAITKIPSMAIDGPSMPIGKSCDGHRWAIDGLRWAVMGPLMPIDGIEWSLSTGYRDHGMILGMVNHG